MNKNVWFLVQAMIFLEDGMSQFEVLSKGIPIDYVIKAKKIIESVTTK